MTADEAKKWAKLSAAFDKGWRLLWEGQANGRAYFLEHARRKLVEFRTWLARDKNRQPARQPCG